MMVMTLVVTVLGLFVLGDVAAAEIPFTLDVLSAGTEVSLTAPQDGSVPLTVVRTAATPPATAVDLQVTQFLGDSGTMTVLIALPHVSGSKPATDHPNVAFPGAALPLRLEVPPTASPGQYNGRLFLTMSGQTIPAVWKIKLAKPTGVGPAVLVANPTTVSFSVTAPWCIFGWCVGGKPAMFSVQLREKAGQWPLEGITVRLEQVSKQPGGGFDLAGNTDCSFDGGRAFAPCGTGPSSGTWRIAAGAQGSMAMRLRGLQAGDYNAVLRFTAANAPVQDEQRVTLALQVRHGIGLAFLIMVVAVAMSFVGTKFVSMLRQRAAFIERVRALRPPWLAQEPPTLPVVWVQSMLRQAEDLSQRFWLTGQAQIDARLTLIETTLSVLDQIRLLRRDLAQDPPSDLLAVRAQAALTRITGRLEGPLPPATATAIKKDLDALAVWIDPAQKQACYWADLSAAVTALLGRVRSSEIADPAGKRQVELLVEKLSNLPPPTTFLEIHAIEERHARLKILWERHDAPEFSTLVQIQAANGPLRDLFRAADEAAWTRLSAAHAGLRVVAPEAARTGTLEAYAPLTFRVETPGDPRLMRTFLFSRGLTYEWEIILTEPAPEAGGSEFRRMTLRPVSAEPQVTQYAPQSGKMTARVRLVDEGRSLDVTPPSQATIGKSSEFRAWQFSEAAELVALAAALVAALVSGLLLYAKSPTFGSFQDYITLFIWGAGVDQGKNFLQALGAYSSAPKNS
jgi:hypothetical protein